MKYQVITITNERVLVVTLYEKEAANAYFKAAKYGYPEGEKVEKIYLTINRKIVAEWKDKD